jgi:cell wall-associated NlpC family hydrolase
VHDSFSTDALPDPARRSIARALDRAPVVLHASPQRKEKPTQPSAYLRVALASTEGLRHRVLVHAAGELGVRELPNPHPHARGEDPTINEDREGRIRQYRLATGSNRGPEAYCADFVSWCFREAGAPLGPNGRGTASAPEMVRLFAKLGRFEPAGKGYVPKAGDVVAFVDRAGSVEHVGVVVGVERDGRLHTIEGNTWTGSERNAGVMERSYSRGAERVLGFGRAV